MKMIGVFILVFIYCNSSSSQLLPVSQSPGNAGILAYSNRQSDVFSFTGNQACLLQSVVRKAGIYSEQRFMMKENTLFAGGLIVPSGLGHFGLLMQYAGFAGYNETLFGVAYARRLGPKIDAGIQFNHYGYRVPGYFSEGAFGAELGIMLHLTEKLNAGIQVCNPLAGKFSKQDIKLQALYRAGFGFDASGRVFIGIDITKEPGFPVNASAGFRYHFAERFFMGAGIGSATGSVYGSAGIAWGIFRLNVTGSYHPQLGITPGILLQIGTLNTNQRSKNQAE